MQSESLLEEVRKSLTRCSAVHAISSRRDEIFIAKSQSVSLEFHRSDMNDDSVLQHFAPTELDQVKAPAHYKHSAPTEPGWVELLSSGLKIPAGPSLQSSA